ncbi:amidase [Armatimonas sp.]|uniref:amidase n=1 Tax=Armatimonas sp. TaxID=1872638 RepID=UPI00374D759E
MEKISRREMMTGAAMAAVSTLAGETQAQEEKKETQKSEKLTESDLLAADRLIGRETTEAERTQLLSRMAEFQKNLKAVRTSPLIGNLPPAFHFNPVIAGVTLPTGKSEVKLSKSKLPTFSGDVKSLAFASVATLTKLLVSKKITSRQLTEMYLERLKTYGPRLLCVVSLLEDTALAQAEAADKELAAGKWRGPLHGIPFGLKDLFFVKGTRTTFGAPPYKNQVLAELEATVAVRLRDAGAVLCAKFSMGELAMGDVWFGGITRNPWDVTRGSSGSSAGSASAVAAGLVGFALGTETYGSIVSPSRECGATGLRPSFGRVSRHGAMALSWTMDKVGPICRSVEDCALVFVAIHGPDGLDDSVLEDIPFTWKPDSKLAGLRVGFDEAGFERASGAQKEVLTVLRGLGVTPKPVRFPKSDPAYAALPGLTIHAEGAAAFAELAAAGGLRELVQQGSSAWPNTFREGALIPAADYLQAQRVRRHLQKEMIRALSEVDVYVTPAGSAPSITYTNLTGQPTLLTRCGKSERGLPISIEFTGNLFREDAVLRLAFAYEQATQWHTQWPDVESLPVEPPPLKR